ncbi:glycoside hydrolase family 15 protein [Plantactinospora siamensis]|uniref:Glycoside hydrolase family 15 protein n=1 Tax=Plantactinospora siamensis TaxID=555372 RepID=A0ABV6P6C9_9ACTN
MRAARTLLAAAAATSLAVPVGASAGWAAGDTAAGNTATGRSAAARGDAPGAPGAAPNWTSADKSGFGTAYGAKESPVWFTVGARGGLTEVYYPDLGTPSGRSLDFVVSDGRTAVRAGEAGAGHTEAIDGAGLTFTHTDTAAGKWRLTTRYVTDPARASVLVDVSFTSLDRRPRTLYTVYDPGLTNDGSDDTAASAGGALTAADGHTASVLSATPRFTATSSGYAGASDGWTDLRDGRMDWRYASARTPGNVVQTARTAVTGVRGRQHTTLALSFGPAVAAARSAAGASLTGGFPRAARAYADGWQRYLRSLDPAPASLRGDPQRRLFRVSEMVLAASEDKTHPGAFIASPSMPWYWREEVKSGPYHLVWSRDLYQIATGLIAAGDVAGARRALNFLFDSQQRPDGSFPQNTDVAGVPVWDNLQLDEVALPIVLAAQLRRTDPGTWSHVKRAADFLIGFSRDGHTAPWTPQERWENQSGYSPNTIAAEIAGLVCAAGIARANGDGASADRYLATADDWQSKVDSWTVTSTGPYDPKPYYLRLSKDGDPNAATTYAVGDSGPSAVDQRAVVDPSFLDLVRLGVQPADHPAIRNTLAVVDRQLGYTTAGGRYWHRASFDGYGETLTGADWNFNFPADSRATRGRGWPLLNGERGEYDLAAGNGAGAGRELAAMANTASPSLMLPEQVWDDQPPSGQPGYRPGTGTRSATPLIWTHAQYVRLAVDLAAGRVVEQPAEVAARYR